MDDVVRVVTVVDSKTETVSLVLTGKCLMCGDCCRLMCKNPMMLNEKGICKYLGEDNLCDIQARRVEPSDDELAWWKANCETFPVYLADQDAERLKASLLNLGWPTKNCGYTMEVE